jgi:RNA polymerase sigma-70 factor (ECF subfamily)
MAWLVDASGTMGCPRPDVTTPRAYANAPDDELARWSAGGDERAFDEIVVRHGPFALRVAVRLLGDNAAAEDVVQEAMMRAWTQAGKFDPRIARFTTWLYRIVVNLCIDHRRRKRPDAIPEGFDQIDPAASVDEIMEAQERNAAFAAAFKELPAHQQAAMTLVYEEEMSGAEAARVLGLSAKAVERLLARARAYLRNRLKAELPSEGVVKC